MGLFPLSVPHYKNDLNYLDKIFQGDSASGRDYMKNFPSKRSVSVKILKHSEWNHSQNLTDMSRYISVVQRCCIKVMYKSEPTF